MEFRFLSWHYLLLLRALRVLQMVVLLLRVLRSSRGWWSVPIGHIGGCLACTLVARRHRGRFDATAHWPGIGPAGEGWCGWWTDDSGLVTADTRLVAAVTCAHCSCTLAPSSVNVS